VVVVVLVSSLLSLLSSGASGDFVSLRATEGRQQQEDKGGCFHRGSYRQVTIVKRTRGATSRSAYNTGGLLMT
jgi:hypothetical protein